MAELSVKEMMKQLETALSLLKDAVLKVDKGNDNYYVLIGLQLRALICLGNKKSFNPLLIRLSNYLNFPLDVYSPKSADEIPVIKDYLGKGLALLFRGSNIINAVPYDSPSCVKYSLEEWLSSKILVFKGDIYSPNEILRFFGDKEANHYDKNLPEKYLSLKNIFSVDSNRELDYVRIFLKKTAEVIVLLGDDLINYFKNNKK